MGAEIIKAQVAAQRPADCEGRRSNAKVYENWAHLKKIEALRRKQARFIEFPASVELFDLKKYKKSLLV